MQISTRITHCQSELEGGTSRVKDEGVTSWQVTQLCL